jgi:hypothetical protein
MATIAEQLVAEDLEMLLPVNKDKFQKAIKSIYEAGHTIPLTRDESPQTAPVRHQLWSPGPLRCDFVIAKSRFRRQN